MNIKRLLELTIERVASDLHVIPGTPPILRIEGQLLAVPNEPLVTPDASLASLKEVLAAEQFERLLVNKEIDFSLSFSEKARFRVNAYSSKGAYAIDFRRIPIEIPEIDNLGLPKVLHSFTSLRQGFVLITGPTGHGKSTTLASILNEINHNRETHIVTIEDPIEFVFRSERSIISQREMGEDTHSWP